MKPLAILFGYPAYYTTKQVLNPPKIKPAKPKNEDRESRKGELNNNHSIDKKIEALLYLFNNDVSVAYVSDKFEMDGANLYKSVITMYAMNLGKVGSYYKKHGKLPPLTGNQRFFHKDIKKKIVDYAAKHSPKKAVAKYSGANLENGDKLPTFKESSIYGWCKDVNDQKLTKYRKTKGY
jgi:hypothetical protein